MKLVQACGLNHDPEIRWRLGTQHLANVEHAPVDLNSILAERLVMHDPSKALGRSEFYGNRPQRIGVTGTIKKSPVATHDAGEESDPRSQALSSSQLRRLSVLIVEDEAIVAMELEMLFEDLNVDVVGIATSAAEACALVLENKPDFVTMDINIKGNRDGVSAAMDIFEIYGVRSIFISSYSDLVTKELVAACHPIAWIKKPVDTADLTDAVRLVLRLR